MSTWRDIWRYGVIANRIFAEDPKKGLIAIRKLSEVYGKDGMIHYIYAEALENKKLLEPAKKEYQIAKALFPVAHWKEVAENSIKRVGKTPEEYFGLQIKRLRKHTQRIEEQYAIKPQFDKLLWYAFQKVYSFVYLNDFARYVSLSALSRGSSEWPLSLVDFRTVLELEIKQCFPSVVNEFDDDDRYSLSKTIIKLEEQGKITSEIRDSFDNIRKAGNIATHDTGKLSEAFKQLNVVQFVNVLNFFNNYRKSNDASTSEKIPYPLCQISLADFEIILNEEKKKQTSK